MSKPQIAEKECREILEANKTRDAVCIIAIRGYYLDSFGKKGTNDRNVYDDVMIVISPRRFETFRANTDPSVYRKGIATMQTGVHRYYKGKHKNRYWALRLVGEQVKVTRDGQNGVFIGVALNIHKGGNRTTGSDGCQTLMPADWDDFIEIVYDEMTHYGQKTIPYVLIDETERRRGAYGMPHIAPTNLTDSDIDKILNHLTDSSVEPPPAVRQPEQPAEIFDTASDTSTDTAAQPEAKLTFNEWLQKAQSGIAQAQQTADTLGQAKGTFDSVKSYLPGGKPTDDAIKVTSGKKTNFFLNLFGMVLSLLAAIWGFLIENWKLIGLGIVGIVIICIVISFVFAYINGQKMKYFSDPHRFNVE